MYLQITNDTREESGSDDADSDIALSHMVGGAGQNACTYDLLLLWHPSHTKHL